MSCLKLLFVQTDSRRVAESSRELVGDVSIPDGCVLSRLADAPTAAAIARVAPDVLVVEHRLNKDASLRTVRTLRSLCPHIPTVMLAWESNEEFAIAALNAGVSRYIKVPCREGE
jgi:DNA-binding NarL/FixJ family response regulator